MTEAKRGTWRRRRYARRTRAAVSSRLRFATQGMELRWVATTRILARPRSLRSSARLMAGKHGKREAVLRSRAACFSPQLHSFRRTEQRAAGRRECGWLVLLARF